MRITKQWLHKKEACRDGYEYYLEKGETDLSKFLKMCLKDDHFDWANWVLTKKFTKKQNIQYACFAAKQVLSNFEKEFPSDKRPREAINAALKCIKNNTAKNRSAANSAANSADSAAVSAANSAYSAAYSAANSANSAYSAASSAAVSAANSANSARSAAYSAANSAADSANSLKKKIINYGIKLLEGK